MFLLAKKNLFQDKGKLLMSLGGTAFAIVLMVILEAILFGTLHQAGTFSRNIGADIFVAQKGVNNMIASTSVLSNNLKTRIENFSEVEHAVPIFGTIYSFNIGNKKVAAYLIGFDPKLGIGGPWKLAAGDSVLEDKEVIIDEFIAKNNHITIGDSIELSGDDYKVIGLSTETNSAGSQYIFTTKKDAEHLLLSPNAVNYFLITLKDPLKADEIAKLIENKIPEVSAYFKDEFALYNEQVYEEMISSPLQLMSGISFFIGIMVVGLTVYTATLSKIKEYAVLKAIGASNLFLYATVFFQSLISTVIGFFVGCILSIGAARMINSFGQGVTATIEPGALIQCFIFSLLMSLIASYIPIRKIASIDPASVFK